jgi:glycosyltransferase involved in cell wall biosynthesis
MKILICASEYYPYGSGIANVAYNVVEQLKKMGVDCTVCSPTGPDVKLKSLKGYGRLGLLHYWYKVSEYFKNRADDYDVAWLHYPLFLGKNPFERCLITIHSTAYGIKYPLHTYLYSYNKFSSIIEKYCLSKIADEIPFTAVSRQIAYNDLEAMGIGHKKVTYIPNGVNTGIYKPSTDKEQLRYKFDIPMDSIVFLSVGRIVYPKMPFRMVDLFDKIQETSWRYMLIIAGEGKLFNPLKKYVMKKNIRNIKFLGFVPPEGDLPDLYACSDYYIMTSKYEGQPLTLLEAMSSGLPCIVSDIPNLRIVEDARCGIVVDFNDIGKAADEIIRYLYMDKSENSKNAREYAVNNLDWRIIAGRYLEAFENIVFEKEAHG